MAKIDYLDGGLCRSEREERADVLREAIQSVLLALPKEVFMREYYMSAATGARNKEMRELFLGLAGQERVHEAELRRLLKDLKGRLAKP